MNIIEKIKTAINDYQLEKQRQKEEKSNLDWRNRSVTKEDLFLIESQMDQLILIDAKLNHLNSMNLKLNNLYTIDFKLNNLSLKTLTSKDLDSIRLELEDKNQKLALIKDEFLDLKRDRKYIENILLDLKKEMENLKTQSDLSLKFSKTLQRSNINSNQKRSNKLPKQNKDRLAA